VRQTRAQQAAIKKALELKHLQEINKAFGGQRARLEALYGRDQGPNEKDLDNGLETPEIRRKPRSGI
jgi:hypothetical protein